VPRSTLPPVSPAILQLFEQEYRALRPRAPMPLLEVKFRRFTSLNTTIRLRDGKLIVRLSDLLEHSPETIHQAIAHILLAKLYRKPVAPVYADRYRRYTRSEAVSSQAERMRQMRGRKVLTSPQGHLYDLDEVFEAVNRRFFHGLLGRPTLTWSAHVAKRMLGHYDAAHNTIVVSRVFDRPGTPRYAVEYLLYHEMLHLKHPVRVRAGRRCVHSREFQAEERLFPELELAKAFLRRL
jgi:hypothetical protein